MNGGKARITLAFRRLDVVLGEIPSSDLFWLSPEERIRYESFTTRSRRQQFLCGRFLARQAISHIRGGTWDEYELSAPEGNAPRLTESTKFGSFESQLISISHTDGWVACAVSTRPIGVDIQSRKKARDILGLSQMINLEIPLEADQSNENLKNIFYAQWGLREAWIKQSDNTVDSAKIPRFVIGKSYSDRCNGLVADVGDATLAVYPASLDALDIFPKSAQFKDWVYWSARS